MNHTDKFLPRYIQFANQIQAQITGGTFAPGEMLPSQRDLAEQFGTTLMTIRKAINVLEEEGLLRSEHGVGTFVTKPDLQEEQYQLLSVSTEMNQRPIGETETRVLRIVPNVTHPRASLALRLPKNNALILLERLRIRNGIPFAYQRSFLPPQFAEMIQGYTPTSSLYTLLHNETGQAMAMAKEFLQPIILTPEDADLLHGNHGDPAWLSIRVSSTQEGVPLVFDEAILTQESFVLTVDHIGKRTNCQFNMLDETSPDVFNYLMEE